MPAYKNRLPVEDAKPIVILSPEQEGRFLEACSDWEFPIFLTLMLTGLRPGELRHLLLEDLDLKANLLHVRNKPSLGWQVKTRSQRQIPVVYMLAEVLRREVTGRTGGVLFRQRRCARGYHAPFEGMLRGASRPRQRSDWKIGSSATDVHLPGRSGLPLCAAFGGAWRP